MINKALLKEYCNDIGIDLSAEQLEKFDLYAQKLVDTNKVMNLTAIIDADDIIIKHFVDSIELLKYADIKSGDKVIDVGTGAGFPGIPLLICKNDIQLTLLDSLSKRLAFLEDVLNLCELKAELIHSRAEDAGNDIALRETFDIATARAVAPLNVLAEYCLPFVKVGGSFIALKGNSEDLEQGKNAVTLLGGEVRDCVSYKLPNGDPRTIVIIKKISQTPTNYPRKPKKIASVPLE